MNSKKSKACTLVREAFLRNGDYNVIVVDWSSISKRPYLWASKRVLMVAQYVSKMIDFLVSQGMRTSQLTIVGHSLGGHIAGLSSYYAKSKAHYVVALDPALPNFYSSGQGTRVSKGDANYVQVIHTNAGGLGYKSSIGDADYFPNGGTKQNGCINVDGGACSHSRSYFYYAESIDSKVGFAGRNCDNYDNYLNGKCKTNLLSLMGGLLPKFNIKGNFYLKTTNKSPFAMGNLVDY
ncbi:pancreatic triacylglycerol lipase-like [Ceratina calcarata]|uniref:phospholipase A1 n=1 Tax=Ceratina calcarata TaxID=156304 RepID=A0AAJ7S0N8_9HYME|nr:pancreatic triacylglycerol lipase-like [Ceratina calcarata]